MGTGTFVVVFYLQKYEYETFVTCRFGAQRHMNVMLSEAERKGCTYGVSGLRV